MSDPKKFALYGGIVMLVIGVLAFVPNLFWNTGDLPVLKVEASYGYFLGQVPMNVINKVGLIVLGLLGITAANWRYNSLPMSINYSRFIMVLMAVLAALGLYQQTNTLFGYMPLFGANVLFYGLFALVAGYFGFKLSSMVPDTYKERHIEPHEKRHFPIHFGHR